MTSSWAHRWLAMLSIFAMATLVLSTLLPL